MTEKLNVKSFKQFKDYYLVFKLTVDNLISLHSQSNDVLILYPQSALSNEMKEFYPSLKWWDFSYRNDFKEKRVFALATLKKLWCFEYVKKNNSREVAKLLLSWEIKKWFELRKKIDNELNRKNVTKANFWKFLHIKNIDIKKLKDIKKLIQSTEELDKTISRTDQSNEEKIIWEDLWLWVFYDTNKKTLINSNNGKEVCFDTSTFKDMFKASSSSIDKVLIDLLRASKNSYSHILKYKERKNKDRIRWKFFDCKKESANNNISVIYKLFDYIWANRNIIQSVKNEWYYLYYLKK